LLLASVFVLPSYVTIFCHTAYFLPWRWRQQVPLKCW
jgi:hypothetical protein